MDGGSIPPSSTNHVGRWRIVNRRGTADFCRIFYPVPTCWDCLHLVDYQTIVAKAQDSWNDIFEPTYAPPDLRGKGSRVPELKTSWLPRLNKTRHMSAHERMSFPISTAAFSTRCSVSAMFSMLFGA